METLRIRTSDHPYFAPFAALYAESFPAFELQTAPQRQAASAKRVLLEIDPVTDYVSAAHLRFYKHCGLTENPYEHRHPPYRPEFKAHPLVVLTTEGTMTEESYLRFYRELRAVVMALPDVPGA